MEVYFISVKLTNTDRWVPQVLKLGVTKGKHVHEIHYALDVHTIWLANKLLEDLKEENPDKEYKIFKTTKTSSLNIEDAKEAEYKEY